MLTIYKTTEQGLQQVEKPTRGCWINAIGPSPEEIAQLIEWGFDPDLITYSLDLDEMARLERDEDEGYTFVLLRAPLFQGLSSDIPYLTIPLGIIIKGDLVATVCRFENDIVRVLGNSKYRGLRTAKRYRFVLYALLETATRFLGHLREINKTVEGLEDQLQLSTRNREVLELLKYQKSLTYFISSLRSNEVMLERLHRTKVFNQFEEDQELLEDVMTENQQALQMTHIASDILSSMMDAFASIISNNMNTVVKVLTAITIIVSLPTMIFSFFGMNVDLPVQSHPLAFIFILLFSMILIGVAVYVFAKRDWF
ncbi:MAG: magnesium transporter [Anaerolineaceae bacterium]|nr:MAG: magnesium transporter [Anaerolineaceae bacterium]